MPHAVHVSLLQDALPAVMATAWELAVGCTQTAQLESQHQLWASGQVQSGEYSKGELGPEAFPKLLYIQSCGQLIGIVLRSASLDALREASAAAALVSSLGPSISCIIQLTIVQLLKAAERESWWLLQVNACEGALRLGAVARATQDQQGAVAGTVQQLEVSVHQVCWACSASLVCAVADKMCSCVHQVAMSSTDTQQQRQAWSLTSRNKTEHEACFDPVGSTLEVLSHAWEVLSADDTLIAAATQHIGTLLDTVKCWLSADVQATKHGLDAHTAVVLLHMCAASAGLQVCGREASRVMQNVHVVSISSLAMPACASISTGWKLCCTVAAV